MEWAGEAVPLQSSILGVCLLKHPRVERLDRVEHRSCLVVRLDPLDIGLDQRTACEIPGPHGGMGLRNRGFDHVEGLSRCGGAGNRCEHHDD